MESRLDDYDIEPLMRPTFLTVLCILTFIGSGWSILSGIYSYTTAKKTTLIIENRFGERDSMIVEDSSGIKDSVHLNGRERPASQFEERMKASFSKMLTVENIRKSAIGGSIAAIFTLLGAILMWRLKRTGFYLYILGVIIGGVIPIYLYGNNFLAIGMSSFGVFFGLVFIALYALNLKSMK